MKLTIVEDNVLLREGLWLACSRQGYALDGAFTAREADVFYSA